MKKLNTHSSHTSTYVKIDKKVLKEMVDSVKNI